MNLTPGHIEDICDRVESIIQNVIAAHQRDPFVDEDPETCEQQYTEIALEYLRQELSHRTAMKEMFEIWAKHRHPGKNPLLQEQKRAFCEVLGLKVPKAW